MTQPGSVAGFVEWRSNPHLHRLEIHPSSQTSCRSCSWVLWGGICQRDRSFRDRFHPERSDWAPLTPGYTRRKPSPPGMNSLHTRTLRLADPQRFRRISLEKIRRQLIVWVLCRKVEKLSKKTIKQNSRWFVYLIKILISILNRLLVFYTTIFAWIR